MVTLSGVWDDTVAFLRREASLLVPLALATLFVSEVLATLAFPGQAGAASTFATRLVVIVAIVWRVFGIMALLSLVTRPGLTVGEALSLGIKRLPKIVLVLLIGLACLVILFIPLAFALMRAGFDPNTPDFVTVVPGWARLCIFLIGATMTWLFARLAPVLPVIADCNPPVITTFTTAFAMTKGFTWRLLGALIVYQVTVYIASRAALYAFGSIFLLLGQAIGSPFAGLVLTALATASVSSALFLVAIVFIGMFYRALIRGT